MTTTVIFVERREQFTKLKHYINECLQSVYLRYTINI